MSNKQIRDMIVPLFFEQFLALLVGLADSFMVSFAGDAAVSGVSLVNMFITFFIYLFTALATGGAIVISQYIGTGDMPNARKAAGQLLTAATLLSLLVMSVTLLFHRELLHILFGSVEDRVMEACITYLKISALSFPALAVYNAGAALCRSTGETAITMKVSLISNLINIAGNAVGVFILHAGVAGVAYPTLIARTFSALVILLICANPRRTVYYQAQCIFSWDSPMLRCLMNVAVPNGIESGLFQLTKVALSSITALFGTAQIAANGIGQNIWSIAAMISSLMGTVAITVIGQSMGSGDIEETENQFYRLLKMSLKMSVIWNVLIFAATPFVMQLFPVSDEVKHMVVLLVLLHNVFCAVVQPFSAVLPCGLRATGDVRYTMIVGIIVTLAVRLVLSVFLGMYLKMGVFGVALAMCIDWCARGVLFWHRFRTGKWKTMKVISG